METTHTYHLTVQDTDTGDIIIQAQSFTADGIIEEAGKAERYMSARLADMDAEETISETEADRIETDSHLHA
jgi:hypothetical protein